VVVAFNSYIHSACILFISFNLEPNGIAFVARSSELSLANNRRQYIVKATPWRNAQLPPHLTLAHAVELANDVRGIT